MSVSCKNKNDNNATEEVVEATKLVLADDVLAAIDEIAQNYIEAVGEGRKLTVVDKLVLPDYLMDPAQTKDLITKSQKVSAYSILFVERMVRKAYDMPLQETDEALTRLAAEINCPLSLEDAENASASERIATVYNHFKEYGEIPSFWRMTFTFQNEFKYLIANDPEIFLQDLGEEDIKPLYDRYEACLAAIKALAEYDTEMADVFEIFENSVNPAGISYEQASETYSTLDSAIKHIVEYKDVYADRRAALLR